MLKILARMANESRRKSLDLKLKKATSTRDSLCHAQSVAVINDDTDAVLRIRVELQEVDATISELQSAIPVVEQQIESRRQAEIDRERGEHVNAAIQHGMEKRKAAERVDTAFQNLEASIVNYRRLTNLELRAGIGAGTLNNSVAPMLRLNHRLRAAMWKFCPAFCKEAGIARLSAARWQSIADSHANETANPDTAKSA